MFGDIGFVVGYQTAGAVLMNIILMLEEGTVLRVNRTVGMDTFSILFCRVLRETEVRAGAEVAVKLLHIMTFAVGLVELAEVRFVLYHVLKSEILYDLVLREPLGKQFLGE